jgi:hypothetical protein
MVHVKSSWKSHGDKAEDEQVDVINHIRLFYNNFIIFIVLDPKSNLIFLLGL